jgi:hypothetical protein
MKRLLFITCLLFISCLVYGQNTPAQLMKKELQKDIIESTRGFDSIVCINLASYWGDDMMLKGYGYKQGELYKVVISFMTGDTGRNYIVKRVMKRKITDKLKADSIRNIHYVSIFSFSKDSLELKSRTNTYYDISDQSYWSIIAIYPDKGIYNIKQVYALDLYQITREEKIMRNTIVEVHNLLCTEE